MSIRITWDANKRTQNLRKHGFDFEEAKFVFRGITYTFEDDRFSYDEQRFVTLGILRSDVVSIVNGESSHEIRIISFRKATRRETEIYFEAFGG